MPKNVATVTSLVSYLKRQLDKDDKIQNLFVKGEISNFIKHRSNHLYFTLKDDGSRISCIMFKGNAENLNFEPKNGDQVLINVNASIYINSGSLQLYVNTMELDGIGNLFLAFEKTKKELELEGLFLSSHKKNINRFPTKIGIIVGKKTAAREDIITTLNRRWPLAEILEINTLVQGENASNQIIKALLTLDKEECNTIILARGGGSFEDLNCFNDEELARVIFNLKTPIITGIGHEVDFTIADFVADLRAATPTAAAEVCVNDILEVLNIININKSKLDNLCYNIINSKKRDFSNLKNAQVFTNPSILSRQKNLEIANLEQGLDNFLYSVKNNRAILNNAQHLLVASLNTTITVNKQYLVNYQNRVQVTMKNFENKEKLHILDNQNKLNNLIGVKYNKDKKSVDDTQNKLFYSLQNTINSSRVIINNYHLQLETKIESSYNFKVNSFNNKIALLDAYSPLKSLSRGYLLAYSDGILIKSVKQVVNDETIEVKLKDGSIMATVKEIKNGK